MANGYVRPEVLVATQWVADRIRDPDIRLVEVDVDTAAYDQGHIDGAVGWHWKNQLQDAPRRDVVTREDFERLLGGSGIDNTTTIIYYGDNNNWFAAWAYWVTCYYGHDRGKVKLMDGGRKKWVDEKRATTTQVPRYPAKTYRTRQPDLSIRALRDYIAQAVTAGAAFGLVDVRSPREFSGELLAPENLPQEGAQRGGHIPGAQSIPWGMAVREDGTFKSAEELRQIYGGRGITGDKEVIAYCRIGERSAHTWFVLHELLGYSKVRNYDGSWTEWGSVIGAPIER
ncbi:MAG: sulfurtransferase [Chloroflexi bacterium]|nr:sulfurtransferase [Chloroflexota bacterium]